MDLNELQSVRDRERQTDKLQQLRESFYADVGAFIQQLRAERNRAVERADNPFDSTDVQQLSDEIQTAQQTVEALYEKRVGKIVKAASFDAANLPAEVDGMTVEEQALFDNLVGNIKKNRNHVLSLLDGEEPGQVPSGSKPSTTDSEPAPGPSTQGTDTDSLADTQSQPPATDPATPETEEPTTSDSPSGSDSTDGVSAADVMGGDGSDQSTVETDADSHQPVPPQKPPADQIDTPNQEAVNPPVRKDGGEAIPQESSGTGGRPRDGEHEIPGEEATRKGVDRRRVQVVEDVGTFMGSDHRDYDLKQNDVVSLPETNADILLERGVAREL